MTGPEHYREAERLLEIAEDFAEKRAPRGATMSWGKIVEAANAHAALACAAAVVDFAPERGNRFDEWAEAVS